MAMQVIQSALTESLVTLSLACISLLSAYGVYYIRQAVNKVKEQTSQMKDEQLRKQLENALGDVETLSTVTIGAIEQTTAKQLREAVRNGVADREELLKLGRQAYDEIRRKVTPEAQQLITKNLGSFDDYLLKLIETKVLELKALTEV